MRNPEEIANVYATDKIIAVLMTMGLSSRPWHLKVHKIYENLIFDYYEDGPNDSKLKLLYVSEEVADVNSDSINSYDNLAAEAFKVNASVRQQFLEPNSQFESLKKEENPFVTESNKENVEKSSLRYRIFSLVLN